MDSFHARTKRPIDGDSRKRADDFIARELTLWLEELRRRKVEEQSLADKVQQSADRTRRFTKDE